MLGFLLLVVLPYLSVLNLHALCKNHMLKAIRKLKLMKLSIVSCPRTQMQRSAPARPRNPGR